MDEGTEVLFCICCYVLYLCVAVHIYIMVNGINRVIHVSLFGVFGAG